MGATMLFQCCRLIDYVGQFDRGAYFVASASTATSKETWHRWGCRWWCQLSSLAQSVARDLAYDGILKDLGFSFVWVLVPFFRHFLPDFFSSVKIQKVGREITI